MISWRNRVARTMLAAAHQMHGSWGVATAVRWDDRTMIVNGEYVTKLTPVPNDQAVEGAVKLVDAASGLAFHITPPWNAAKSAGFALVPSVPRELERNYHLGSEDHQILVSFTMPPAEVAALVNTRLPRYHDLIRQARKERADGDRAMAKAVEIVTALATRIGGADAITAHPPRQGPHGTEWFGEAGLLTVHARAGGSRIGISFSFPVKDFENNVEALAAVIRI